MELNSCVKIMLPIILAMILIQAVECKRKCRKCTYQENNGVKTEEKCSDEKFDQGSIPEEECPGPCAKFKVKTDKSSMVYRGCNRDAVTGAAKDKCENTDMTIDGWGSGSLHCCDKDLCNHGNIIHGQITMTTAGVILATIISVVVRG